MKYAAATTVAISRSRDEIERTLTRYGAKAIVTGWDQTRVVLSFEIEGYRIRFTVRLPQAAAFKSTRTGRSRTQVAAEKAADQARRQLWRALGLAIKAKLENVESGIEEFTEAFMAQIVLPNGATVGEAMTPQIEEAYATGTMPALLPPGGSGDR